MMNRIAFLSVATAIVTLALVQPYLGMASEQMNSPRALTGLEAVEVVIPEVGEALFDRGITEDVIFAEVQLQLRRAGIDMLDPERPRAKPVPGNPTLRVEVLANVNEQYDQASFAVQLTLWQDVKLEREANQKRGGRTYRAVTWSTGGIGESGSDWRNVLRDELSFYVDRFVQDWLTVNRASAP